MIYFVSDTHLGYGNAQSSREREIKLVHWLESIETDCRELYILGDFFDFWFEYKRVVPKGFIRVLAQLARMVERGVKISFFAGNHDLWVRDYLHSEIGITIYTTPTVLEVGGHKMLLAHGDGLAQSGWVGPALSRTFRSRTARWFFQRLIHPDTALRFGQWWSSGNKERRGKVSHEFRGVDEPLVKWAIEQKKQLSEVEFFVFGHLHTPAIVDIEGAQVVVLGEWIERPTTSSFDGERFKLHRV